LTAPLISVRGLHFRYPDGTPALNGIDFNMKAGEAVALLGANGSGKTTFVLHLLGLLRGEGTIEVAGIPVEPEHYSEVRRRVGLVFQDPDEQLFMPTVLDDVTFGPLNLGATQHDAIIAAEAALEAVGMASAARRAPYHLSAGEKRRVALAGVLAMKPELLILDEPTTYLDPPGQRELMELLGKLRQAKILVTHDAAFARALAARAAFFEQGQISFDGPIDEAIRRFKWQTPASGS
jgi:energy-coupling factor transporter ATP-binding protein EcfA2